MRGSALVLIAAVAGALLSFAASEVTGVWPLVTISSGKIIGRNFTSPFTNKFMYAFQGIPYGAAPVSSNRFKPPEPPANWTYKPYLDCTKDGPVCFQDAAFGLPPVYVMTEDCLNLNVYTSSLTGKMPVMVWIHGGANLGGSGAYDVSAPDMLVAEEVVVVSINYRLGALGFLTLGTADAPGNAALHDQILALQWVRTNIKQFGGDPAQVTIWGESSGSTCVHLLYMSPMARGLFQGAIAESGTALVNAVWKDGSSYGYDLARALNCNSSDPTETLKCLQMIPADDIINAQSNNVSVSFEDTVNGNWLAWRANVDKELISQPLLPDMPENLWLQGKTSTVPILLGNVVDEGVVKLIGTPDSEVMNITDNLQYFIPEKTRNSLSASKLATLTQKIRDFYLPNNSTVSPTNIRPYVNLLGDYMFKYGTSVSARMFKKRQDNVFVYLFNYDGTFKGVGGDVLDKKYNTSFISHGMDLEYLFVPNNLTTPLAPGNPDLLTWQRMVRMWANFAKHGYPTLVLNKDPLLQNISWNAVGVGDKTYYLNIGVNLTMVADAYLKDVVTLWDPILGGVPTSGSERLQMTALLVTVVAFLRFF